MLVTISLVFCLSGGVQCQTVRPDNDQYVGLAACAIAGQQLGAAYIEDHPRRYLSAVRCTPGNPPREDDI